MPWTPSCLVHRSVRASASLGDMTRRLALVALLSLILPAAMAGPASAGSPQAEEAARRRSRTAARPAIGPITFSPPTRWAHAWAPTTSSPTSSPPRPPCSPPGTRTRSAGRRTSPATPSSLPAARPRRSTASPRPAGSPRTSRSPRSRRSARRSGSRVFASATRSTTAATRCRRSRRSSTSPSACRASSGARSGSIRRPSTDLLPLDRAPALGAALPDPAARRPRRPQRPRVRPVVRGLDPQWLDDRIDVPLVQLLPAGQPAPTTSRRRRRAHLRRHGHPGGPAGDRKLRRRRRPVEGLHRPARRRRDLAGAASFVRDAHRAGLLVHPYTFRNETRSCRSSCARQAPRGLRPRVRRVRAVLRARRGRTVLRQPRHGGRG